MSDWMKDFKSNRDKDNANINDATKKILDAIKGLDRVSCIPTILANLFEGIENETGKDEIHGFRNQMVNWGIETYTARKLTKVIPNLLALHAYCKDKEYTEDNTWEWGSGDRTVCYIPSDSKDVLLFENQNIQFVVVFDGYKINVREAFKRIDLNNMKQHNFGKKSPAFTYGDNRDKGYLMSMCTIFSDKCEINDINRSGYAFDDMAGATMRIPKKYIKAIKRDNKLNELLD